MIHSSYRYFLAIAEQLSIRKAAERVHISPSAISRQVSLLEEACGQPLLVRKANGVELTPAGRILTRHIRSIMRQEHVLKGDLADLANLRFGHVRLSIGNGFASSLANLVLPRFSTLHPGFTYLVAVEPGDEVLRSIVEDHADIGVTFNPASHPSVEVVTAFHAPLLAITSPLRDYGQNGMTLEDLARLPLALPRFNHGIRRILQQVEMSEGIRLRPAVESNSYEVLKAFVTLQDGVTLFPFVSVAKELSDGSLRSFPLRNDTLNKTMAAIIVRRGRQHSLATTEFLRFLQDELACWAGAQR